MRHRHREDQADQQGRLPQDKAGEKGKPTWKSLAARQNSFVMDQEGALNRGTQTLRFHTLLNGRWTTYRAESQGKRAITALAVLDDDGLALHGIRFDRMRDSDRGDHLCVAGEQARPQETSGLEGEGRGSRHPTRQPLALPSKASLACRAARAEGATDRGSPP
jgi:hypothetical protein